MWILYVFCVLMFVLTTQIAPDLQCELRIIKRKVNSNRIYRFTLCSEAMGVDFII